MFKVSKLKNTNDEKIDIEFIKHEKHNFTTKKIDSFKTLSFYITGTINKNRYSFSFVLDCRVEDLLNIKENETTDFKNFIFESETYFNLNGISYLDPIYDIKIYRYLGNKFVVNINFYSEDYSYNNDTYSGMIEFEFNLDDYLDDNIVN